MQLKQPTVPRAGACLLVLIAVVSFASANWLMGTQFSYSDELQALVLLCPMGLLALWCALGRTNLWLRFAVISAACGVWYGWISRFPPIDDDIEVPYFIGIFATIVIPLLLVRLTGVSIQMTPSGCSQSAASQDSLEKRSYPRFSLWTLLQATTLGAVLMAADRLFGFSEDLGFEEVRIGAAIAAVAAAVAWVCLGTQRLWLRLVIWLIMPAILYLPMDGEWKFIQLIWLGISALIAAELLCFRRLGYRLVWGNLPIVDVNNDPIPWRTLLWTTATLVLIGLYLAVVSQSVTASQRFTHHWYIDGMATFGAYLTSVLQAPIYLLAIWCALGAAGLATRLASTAAACAAAMLYLSNEQPLDPLQIDPQSVAQLLIAAAAPLFALRVLGCVICRPSKCIASTAVRGWWPRVSLRNALELLAILSLLMAWHHYTNIFQGLFDFQPLRGQILASLSLMGLIYGCLGTGRWWLRVGTWLLCFLTTVCLASEFPLRNFGWTASASISVGGVLLAFRLRGFRLLRLQSSIATAPILPELTGLPESTEPFYLAVSK